MMSGSALTGKGGEVGMIDKEKVIKGLEVIKQFFEYGLPSTAEMFDSYYGILNDAQKLLKEQEEQIDTQRKNLINLMILLNEQKAVEPKHNPLSPTDWFCGKCGMCISRFHDYCPSCGQAVKWE